MSYQDDINTANAKVAEAAEKHRQNYMASSWDYLLATLNERRTLLQPRDAIKAVRELMDGQTCIPGGWCPGEYTRRMEIRNLLNFLEAEQKNKGIS